MAGRDPNKTRPHGLPAWSRQASIGDYDGSTDKTSSTTEAVPYALSWYQELTAMIGSAFSRTTTSIVHAKKLALARQLAAISKGQERAIANRLPGTADDTLADWAKVLKVPASEDTPRWQVRQQCAARFRLGSGVSADSIDAGLQELLGDLYIRSIRTTGTSLSSPPTQTFWPNVNPGDPVFSLGGGTWTSERSHFTVQVAYPTDGDLTSFLQRVNIDLFQYLDRVLPAWATFNWATWSTDTIGFHLDISRLDLTGLTDS
jgi:hypothetical protein